MRETSPHASYTLKKEVLKPKTHITPRIAETIFTKLSSEEEQTQVIDEINRSRLTEEEAEDWIREIQRERERVESVAEELTDEEDAVYIVDEYDCPHCGRHYFIKCNGKQDWIEPKSAGNPISSS